MITTIQLKRGLEEDWEYGNPVLKVGEPGYATDTKVLKIGDGVTAWNDLVAINEDIDLSNYLTLDLEETITGKKTFKGGIEMSSDEDSRLVGLLKPEQDTEPVRKKEFDLLDQQFISIDLVDGKGLSTNDYTTAEKTKLSGIETGANKYVHPTTHPASIITQTEEARFVTDVEKANWDSKSNFSGDYTDLTKKPSIPTKTSDITNDSNFITVSGAPVQSVSGKTGTVVLTKTDVGLENADNKSSSEIRSEITSTNITSALGFTPMDASIKGANSGVAELDETGKVPASQLPSYVDDIIEFASLSAFPSVGESGKIYTATDTNIIYRWGGTGYVEISSTIALGETSTTAYRGDRGKLAYDHSQVAHAPSNAQKNSDITKAEIEAKLTGVITSHTHSAYVPTSRTVAGKALTDNITISKGDVGLGDVDNTSDVNKPVSTAQQAALDSKQATLIQGSNITITGNTISAADTTYGVATTSVNGLLSSTDKSKLDGIASNANNYSLPTASATVLGGVKVGSGLAISSEVLSANIQSDNNFTSDYKTKLDGIATGANNYAHPSSHPATIITQTSSYRFVTDTEKSTWNAKSNLDLGTTSVTAYRGDLGAIAYNHSQTAHAPTDAQKNSDITKGEIEAKLTGVISTHSHTVTKANVGLGNVDNTSDLAKPISIATQTALNAKLGTGAQAYDSARLGGYLAESYPRKAESADITGNWVHTGGLDIRKTSYTSTSPGISFSPSGSLVSWRLGLLAAFSSDLQLSSSTGQVAAFNSIGLKLGEGVASERLHVEGNGLFEGDIYSGATKVALQNVSINAGNGLSGGGDISANRTITLGTPSTITNSTTNSVSSTSHTHAISLSKADVGLGNVGNYSDYARKTISESISGFWHFNEGVSIGTTCNNSANSVRYFKIGYFNLPSQYNWGHVTIQVKTRYGANHTIFAGVERTSTNVSVYRTFQVIGRVLNQTYFLVRTSANVMELWLRNSSAYDNVQISILNRSIAYKFTPDFSTYGTDALPTNESVVTCTNIINTAGRLDVSDEITAQLGTFTELAVGGYKVATESWVKGTATAYDSTRLGGQLSSFYPRRNVIETISGRWWFDGGINVKIRTVYQNSSGDSVGDITPLPDYHGKPALIINANYQGSGGTIGFQTVAGYGKPTIMDEQGHWTMSGNIAAQGNITTQGSITAQGNLVAKQGSFTGLNIGSSKVATESWVTNNFTPKTSSDIRLKDNIIPIESSLDDILKLNPVHFTYKSDETKTKKSGFIAQELREVYPQFVGGQETDTEYLHIDPANMVSVLTKGMQELIEEVRSLREEINIIKNNAQK